jgi:hypothetical protein
VQNLELKFLKGANHPTLKFFFFFFFGSSM